MEYFAAIRIRDADISVGKDLRNYIIVKRGKRTTQYWAIFKGVDYSAMKRRRRGNPHRMDGCGDIRHLCTIHPHDTNHNKHRPSSRRMKRSLPLKIPEGRPADLETLENEIWPTIDKRRNLHMRGKSMRNTRFRP